MNKTRQLLFFTAISVLLAAVLVVSSVCTISSVKNTAREHCFNELEAATKNLSAKFYATIETDRSMLRAMAEIIADSGKLRDVRLLQIMNSFTFSDFISYVELLKPDNKMLLQNGFTLDTSGSFDFAEEVKKGVYVSERTHGIFAPEDTVVRSAVPVIRGGKIIAILYGVMSLSELSEHYRTDIYSGKASVYIEDGRTGDFILDTRHHSLGNIDYLKDREMLSGHSYEAALSDIKRNIGGQIGFVSPADGGNFYMHYEPIGINNWNVFVSISEDAAFSRISAVSKRMYTMALVEIFATLLYMVCVIAYFFSSYLTLRKLSFEDQLTLLQNRGAYSKFETENKEHVFSSLCCVYFDVNGLHELNNQQGHDAGDRMLRTTAEALRKYFPFKNIYRIGGDEFIVVCEGMAKELCAEKTEAVEKFIEERGYKISSGLVFRESDKGIEDIAREADETMLVNKRSYYIAHDRRCRS